MNPLSLAFKETTKFCCCFSLPVGPGWLQFKASHWCERRNREPLQRGDRSLQQLCSQSLLAVLHGLRPRLLRANTAAAYSLKESNKKKRQFKMLSKSEQPSHKVKRTRSQRVIFSSDTKCCSHMGPKKNQTKKPNKKYTAETV